MIPVMLDGAKLPLALVGRGDELMRRLAWLRDGGAERLTVFTDAASPELRELMGPALVERLPTTAELAASRAMWITGLPEDVAEHLADQARRLAVLVNVEDVTPACDFHSPALVRRGDLLVTISTGGRSPGLAGRVRAWVDGELGEDWAQRLDAVAAKRERWRRQHRTLPELQALTQAMVEHRGWLSTEQRP